MKHFYRYLPLNEQSGTDGLCVTAGGYTLIPPHTPYPPLPHPAGHDFRWSDGRTLQEYQIIYITRGGGRFESNRGGQHEIRPGSVLALFPGEWHRYSPSAATGWDEYWVAFEGSKAGKLLKECGLTASLPVAEIGLNESLVEEYLHIAEELREEAQGYSRIIAARALVILSLIAAAGLRRDFEGTEAKHVINRAKCLMLEQSDSSLNVEKLAAHLNVGYSWFRRTFRQYTGLSPAQYHQKIRLHRACELLRATTLPIAVISEELGFESAEYFTRIFKAKNGRSPREYRAIAQTQLQSK